MHFSAPQPLRLTGVITLCGFFVPFDLRNEPFLFWIWRILSCSLSLVKIKMQLWSGARGMNGELFVRGGLTWKYTHLSFNVRGNWPSGRLIGWQELTRNFLNFSLGLLASKDHAYDIDQMILSFYYLFSRSFFFFKFIFLILKFSSSHLCVLLI